MRARNSSSGRNSACEADASTHFRKITIGWTAELRFIGRSAANLQPRDDIWPTDTASVIRQVEDGFEFGNCAGAFRQGGRRRADHQLPLGRAAFSRRALPGARVALLRIQRREAAERCTQRFAAMAVPVRTRPAADAAIGPEVTEVPPGTHETVAYVGGHLALCTGGQYCCPGRAMRQAYHPR